MTEIARNPVLQLAENVLHNRLTTILVCSVGAVGLQAMAQHNEAQAARPLLTEKPAETSAPLLAKITPSADLPTITKAHKTDFSGKVDVVPITSEASGYVIGNAFNGNSADITMRSDSGDSVLGLIGSNTCGWIESDTLDQPKITSPAGICKPLWGLLKDRTNFGKGFNGDDGEYVDGTAGTTLTDDCDRKAYYNDDAIEESMLPPGTLPDDAGAANYAGKLHRHDKVHYRYTTLDGRYAMVRDNRLGWVFIEKSCIAGYPQGGPEKTPDTVPGAHPNKAV